MTETATQLDTPKKVYRTDDLCAITGKEPYWVRKMARQGKLPGTKVGRDWFFPREQINAMFHICD